MFNQKYPNKHINQSTVSKIEKKFRDHGNVTGLSKGRRPKVANEEMSLNKIIMHLLVHSDSNTAYYIYPFKKSLGLTKYHPYKVQLVHELNEDDPDRRVQFCEQMLTRGKEAHRPCLIGHMKRTCPRTWGKSERACPGYTLAPLHHICNANLMFLRNLICSDESTFTLNRTVNRQNCRYWADVNPHWVMEARIQYPQKVNVWAGIVGNRVVGPYFFEGNLNGDTYLTLL
ncbi:hypothetical protein NQ318_023459 [Aromia moschata]|uniref:Transposase n=1 Tax=Aromia moschata TaxID=1265417 RepID=A0AAV8YM54_9CUCU|nr:hypothetical protein NQ318_023459 [Aromia moschata]